ncbi:stage II sporulation protein D [Paraliobacillus sediminis]|uniref:stage II sporulation protein D n=1 Tax=Paraliobacillus sediminis TaxID=1885916 RepID=UPI001F072523|nr:stage II sporulation protein D [Paraliobacillus sediminis]
MHPYHKNKKGHVYWKSCSMLLIGLLLTIILLVPALIVAPHTGTSTKVKTSTEKTTEKTAETAETVTLSSEDSAFTVEVMRSETDQIEKVLLEDYVTRVVASEMPAEFELEALKAQALAARTYIVNYLAHVKDDAANVTDTIQHQVYKNDEELRKVWGSDYSWKISKIKQAVAGTVGEILTYEEQPITPAFFSTSNGYTENSEDYWENALPYLKSVASPWDQDSPKFLDQKIIPINQVEEALGVTLSQASTAFNMIRTESNRVETVEIAGQTFTGRDIREALDLRSSDFDIEQKNDHLIFTTKGYGHGIGMSQYGANGMAKDGKNYQDIVTYYYQGTEIERIEDATPTLVVKN